MDPDFVPGASRKRRSNSGRYRSVDQKQAAEQLASIVLSDDVTPISPNKTEKRQYRARHSRPDPATESAAVSLLMLFDSAKKRKIDEPVEAATSMKTPNKPVRTISALPKKNNRPVKTIRPEVLSNSDSCVVMNPHIDKQRNEYQDLPTPVVEINLKSHEPIVKDSLVKNTVDTLEKTTGVIDTSKLRTEVITHPKAGVVLTRLVPRYSNTHNEGVEERSAKPLENLLSVSTETPKKLLQSVYSIKPVTEPANTVGLAATTTSKTSGKNVLHQSIAHVMESPEMSEALSDMKKGELRIIRLSKKNKTEVSPSGNIDSLDTRSRSPGSATATDATIAVKQPKCYAEQKRVYVVPPSIKCRDVIGNRPSNSVGKSTIPKKSSLVMSREVTAVNIAADGSTAPEILPLKRTVTEPPKTITNTDAPKVMPTTKVLNRPTPKNITKFPIQKSPINEPEEGTSEPSFESKTSFGTKSSPYMQERPRKLSTIGKNSPKMVLSKSLFTPASHKILAEQRTPVNSTEKPPTNVLTEKRTLVIESVNVSPETGDSDTSKSTPSRKKFSLEESPSVSVPRRTRSSGAEPTTYRDETKGKASPNLSSEKCSQKRKSSENISPSRNESKNGKYSPMKKSKKVRLESTSRMTRSARSLDEKTAPRPSPSTAKSKSKATPSKRKSPRTKDSSISLPKLVTKRITPDKMRDEKMVVTPIKRSPRFMTNEESKKDVHDNAYIKVNLVRIDDISERITAPSNVEKRTRNTEKRDVADVSKVSENFTSTIDKADQITSSNASPKLASKGLSNKVTATKSRTRLSDTRNMDSESTASNPIPTRASKNIAKQTTASNNSELECKKDVNVESTASKASSKFGNKKLPEKATPGADQITSSNVSPKLVSKRLSNKVTATKRSTKLSDMKETDSESTASNPIPTRASKNIAKQTTASNNSELECTKDVSVESVASKVSPKIGNKKSPGKAARGLVTLPHVATTTQMATTAQDVVTNSQDNRKIPHQMASSKDLSNSAEVPEVIIETDSLESANSHNESTTHQIGTDIDSGTAETHRHIDSSKKRQNVKEIMDSQSARIEKVEKYERDGVSVNEISLLSSAFGKCTRLKIKLVQNRMSDSRDVIIVSDKSVSDDVSVDVPATPEIVDIVTDVEDLSVEEVNFEESLEDDDTGVDIEVTKVKIEGDESVDDEDIETNQADDVKNETNGVETAELDMQTNYDQPNQDQRSGDEARVDEPVETRVLRQRNLFSDIQLPDVVSADEVVNQPEDVIADSEQASSPIPDKDTNPLQCLVCDRVFKNTWILSSHLKRHAGRHPYQCDICRKMCSSMSNLQIHMRIHTGSRPFGCSECDKTFKTKVGLGYHMMSHTGEKPHKCDKCEKSFTRPNILKEHMKIHDGKNHCETCSKSFSCDKNYQIHLLLHTDDKPHVCKHCKRAFKQISNLRKHILNVHRGNYQCSHCSEVFQYPDELEDHGCSVSYKCQQCNAVFECYEEYERHQRTHRASTGGYECEYCGKRSNLSGTHRLHLRLHTNERPYECKTCGKTFVSASHLQRHQRTHTGEKPYACEHCGKRFARHDEMSVHLRQHPEKTMKKCEDCGEVYDSNPRSAFTTRRTVTHHCRNQNLRDKQQSTV